MSASTLTSDLEMEEDLLDTEDVGKLTYFYYIADTLPFTAIQDSNVFQLTLNEYQRTLLNLCAICFLFYHVKRF